MVKNKKIKTFRLDSNDFGFICAGVSSLRGQFQKKRLI